jgi:hypothetical protein
MSPAPSVPGEVEKYVAAVRRALADLPSAERDDLLVEVEASLLAATEEGAGPVDVRLGAPEQFAAELRAAAGLHEPAPPVRREGDLVRRLRAVGGRFLAHPGVIAVRRLGRELAPIWWVLRAYLAVGAIAYAVDSSWSLRLPIVPQFGSAKTGLAVIGFAVVVSVWLGLELRRQGSPMPRLAAVVNTALLLAAIPVIAQVTNTSSLDSLVARANAPAPQPSSDLLYEGVRVENIYPYSRAGKLLHDVLLYDQDGRPIDVANRAFDPNRRVVVASVSRPFISDGEVRLNRPLFNTFPIRYYEPGTKRVARPNAAPDVRPPHISTPPLPTTKSK